MKKLKNSFKTMRPWKNRGGIILSLILCMILAMTFSTPASAAKVKTIKKLTEEQVDAACKPKKKKAQKLLNKKARTVKKGTTALKINGEGFLKFKAPKKGKYTLKFYNVRTVSRKSIDVDQKIGVDLYAMSKDLDKLILPDSKVSTKGSKDQSWGFIGTKEYVSEMKDMETDKKVSKRTYTSRSFSLKMKKGEMLYVKISSDAACTFKVKIK